MILSSLFEVYDPYTFYFKTSLNWLFVIFIFLCICYSYWVAGGALSSGSDFFMFYVLSEFRNYYSILKIKTGLLMFIALFVYIFITNIFGLVPYVFACSSHFVYSLSLGLPLWLGFMFLGWINVTNSMFIHLIPVGTPVVLISFMVLIETISNFIRPWSLSIRLMANMISGHLLMSLLGDCGMSVLVLHMVLFLFECSVCVIQAYVYSALLTLYSSEI